MKHRIALEHNMFCGGAVALYSLVGSDPLAHNHRTKLLGHDSKPPPAASSDLTEYIATRVWFRAKCCFHVFHTCTREVAPDRPADFTGVFYTPKYPLDGLGLVPFTQIS